MIISQDSVNVTQIHPDQSTVIPGWIFHPIKKIRLDRKTVIRAYTKPVCIVVCCWCGAFHVHGWADDDPGPHSRIAHCHQIGQPWRAGYTIFPINADDFLQEGQGFVDFKSFLGRMNSNTQYGAAK